MVLRYGLKVVTRASLKIVKRRVFTPKLFTDEKFPVFFITHENKW